MDLDQSQEAFQQFQDKQQKVEHLSIFQDAKRYKKSFKHLAQLAFDYGYTVDELVLFIAHPLQKKAHSKLKEWQIKWEQKESESNSHNEEFSMDAYVVIAKAYLDVMQKLDQEGLYQEYRAAKQLAKRSVQQLQQIPQDIDALTQKKIQYWQKKLRQKSEANL